MRFLSIIARRFACFLSRILSCSLCFLGSRRGETGTKQPGVIEAGAGDVILRTSNGEDKHGLVGDNMAEMFELMVLLVFV